MTFDHMRIPDLDLDQVRCFVTVVESGGFTQASRRLHLTQSAITLKIKRLEELLPVKADLGLSILSPLSLVPGIEIAGKNKGLPRLPTADLALYSRKSPSQPTVQRLASFLVSAVARWEHDAGEAPVWVAPTPARADYRRPSMLKTS